MINDLMNQIILRRDGTVAKVTGISDGWLLLDGSVDDSALPGETLVIDFALSDDEIIKLAREFGIDDLQSKRVPDLARKRLAQENYAYQVLQTIFHPTVNGAYITITGINAAERYKVKIKPEKGSAYEMTLSEGSIRQFEQEGILPTMSDVVFKAGDIVRLGDGDRVVILENKTDENWQILDPVTDDREDIALDTRMFPTSNTIQAVITTLREERINEIAKQGSLQQRINSLLAEIGSMNLAADKAKASQSSTELTTLQAQLDLEKKAHDKTKLERDQALRDAAQLSSGLKQASAAPVSQSGFDKPVECKIIMDTGAAQFEKLWSAGWHDIHIQFKHDGKVMSIWRKYNDSLPLFDGIGLATADPDLDGVELDVHEVADVGFGPAPKPVPMTQNRLGIGPIGQSILSRGLPATLGDMNDHVLDAVEQAQQGYQEQPITRFLPTAEVPS